MRDSRVVWLTSAQVAAQLGVTSRRVQQMAQAGTIPRVWSVRLRRYLFRPEHILEWLGGADLYVSRDVPGVFSIVEPKVLTPVLSVRRPTHVLPMSEVFH